MGTNNFHYRNTSKCFSALMSYESPIIDEDGNETAETETRYPESWEYDEFIEQIADALENIPNVDFYKYGNDKHELRSFCSHVIGQVYTRKHYKDFTIEVNILCVTRAGYYDGICLDFTPTFCIEGDEVEEGEMDFESELSYVDNMSEKRAAYLAPLVQKWAEKEMERLKKEVEKVFEENTTPLVLVAQFSNGEAMYKEA